MKECTDLEVLVMQLKSGEYDGSSIMQACIAIERLIKLEGVCDIAPKWIGANIIPEDAWYIVDLDYGVVLSGYYDHKFGWQVDGETCNEVINYMLMPEPPV